MKTFLKHFLKYYLKCATKIVLARHRPKIVAISGSINKSFFKDAIKLDLEKKGLTVRANEKSFNTEIGLPLAILNLPSGYNSYKNWWPAVTGALVEIFRSNFPQVLILELGVSAPGDMKFLISIARPDIAVITDITQRYLESFSDMDNLVNEYELLAQKTKREGVVILNADNNRVRAISKKLKGRRVIFFGKSKESDWQIIAAAKNERGQRITVEHKREIFKYETNRFGEHHAYAYAASRAVGKAIE